MKKNMFFLGMLFNMLLLQQSGNAQTGWVWAKSAGDSTYDDYGNSVISDAAGNVYVAGRFDSPMIVFGATTLANAGGPDAFVVKFDAAGNVLWARAAGGTGFDECNDVAVDGSGNVYIAGFFHSPAISFGTNTVINSASVGSDLFVAKYDSNGNLVWLRSAGSHGNDFPFSISTDFSGNIYVSGGFNSPTLTFGDSTLVSKGMTDIFLTKYDANGNVLWAVNAGGTNDEVAFGMAVSGNGHVLLTGNFQSPSFMYGSNTLTLAGAIDIFVASYDASGNILWAKGAGGSNMEFSYGIAADGSNNIFVSGSFYSSSLIFGTTTLTCQGNEDIFVVKYDQAGNVLWAKSAGGTGYERGRSISTDAAGNCYATGSFGSPAINFGNHTLNTGNYLGMFIVKYDPSGNVLWATQPNGPGGAESRGIWVGAGEIHVTGGFSSNVSFDNINLVNLHAFYSNVFVARSDKTVGFQEYVYSNDMHIYPNPFSSQMTINFQKPLQHARFVLYNSMGQVVKETGPIYGESFVLNRNDLPIGIYYFRILTHREIGTSTKIIIAD